MSNETKIVIPPDEWDTLELVAEAYGGLGRCSWTAHGEPVCVIGACAFAGIPCYNGDLMSAMPVTKFWHGLYFAEIDSAQLRVAERLADYKYLPPHRVPFLALMSELGAVRGDA